jgi:hypothetical protein
MGKRDLVGGGFVVEDVGGSFKRFIDTAPKVVRLCIYDALDRTRFAMEQRMRATAPVGPDAPHIREHVTSTRRGLQAQVGFIEATQAAGPDNDASIADVALYNEYRPNKQPFMRPAAEAEASDYVKRMKAALFQAERDLSGGGGVL